MRQKLDFRRQPETASSVASEASKHFLKSNLHQKVTVTIWWFAATLIHYSILNPGKIITTGNMVSKSMRCWKLQCLRLALVNRKGPILLQDDARPHVACTSNSSKVEWIGLQSFASSSTFTCPLTITSSNIWPTFCRENASTTSRMQKMLSKSVKSWSMDFYATGINKLISLCPKCLLYWSLFWLIKMCLNLVRII